MSAVDTVQRVLRWASRDEGPPPPGDLRGAEQLSRPPAELVAMWRSFASLAAARMHWTNLASAADPARRSLGLSGLMLAAALGVASMPEFASAMLGRIPRTDRWLDWAARHRLASRALSHVPGPLADALRDASPLTAVLDRPPPGAEAATVGHVRRLLAQFDGRRMLRMHWSQPTSDVAVRDWRSTVLDQLRLQGDEPLEFVLDVYESAIVFHADEHFRQVEQARALLNRWPLDDATQLTVYSVADWWEPLAMIDKADHERVRRRICLGCEFRHAISLVQVCRRLRGPS